MNTCFYSDVLWLNLGYRISNLVYKKSELRGGVLRTRVKYINRSRFLLKNSFFLFIQLSLTLKWFVKKRLSLTFKVN